jgi:hypothetical protein
VYATRTERRYMRAIGTMSMSGPEIASSLDLEYSESFKSRLSHMVNRDLLVHDSDGAGPRSRPLRSAPLGAVSLGDSLYRSVCPARPAVRNTAPGRQHPGCRPDRRRPAQLGYGDGDETTVVSYGPDPAKKYITTYYPQAFTVTDPREFASLTLRLQRDDGAVVYLNGTEVVRSNMPTGTITLTTRAASGISGAAEDTFEAISVDAQLSIGVRRNPRGSRKWEQMEAGERPRPKTTCQQATGRAALLPQPTQAAAWVGATSRARLAAARRARYVAPGTPGPVAAGRTPRRLALLYACSARHQEPVIGDAAARRACAFVEHQPRGAVTPD